MNRTLHSLAFFLFITGLLGAGILGTETRTLFFWPSLGLFACSSCLVLFSGGWKMDAMPSQRAMALTLLTAIYLGGRAWFSPVWSYAREDLVLLAMGLNIYLLSATAFSGRKYRTMVMWILAILLIGNLGVSVIQFEGNWKFHVLPGYERVFGEGMRVGGFYNNSNHFGSFLLIVIFLFVSAAFFSKVKLIGRVMLMFFSLLAIITLIMTVSRGSMIAGLGAGAVWFCSVLYMIKKAYPDNFLKTLVVGCLGLGVMAALIASPVVHHLRVRMEQGGASHIFEGDPRPSIWMAALDQWKTAPVFGVGSRMFHDGCIEFRRPETARIGEALFVHNEWLQCLTEYGMVGLVLVVAMLLVHLQLGISYFKWFTEERFEKVANLQGTYLPIALGAFTALVAIALHSVVEFSLHVPSLAMLTAFLLGVMANPGRVASHELPSAVPGMRWMTRGALIGASCGVFLLGYRHAHADYLYQDSQKWTVRNKEFQIDKILMLNEVLNKDQTQDAAFRDRGELRYRMSKELPLRTAESFLKQAELDLRSAIELNPKHFYYYLLLANILDSRKKFEESYQILEVAHRLAPLYESPRVAFALHFQRQGRWEDAEFAYLWAGETNGVGSFTWAKNYNYMLNFIGRYIDHQLEAAKKSPQKER